MVSKSGTGSQSGATCRFFYSDTRRAHIATPENTESISVSRDADWYEQLQYTIFIDGIT